MSGRFCINCGAPTPSGTCPKCQTVPVVSVPVPINQPTQTNHWQSHWIVGVVSVVVAAIVFLIFESTYARGFNMPNFASSLDGVYVLDPLTNSPEVTMRLQIHGNLGSLSGSNGISGTATFVRVGDTVRVSNDQFYRNGYLIPRRGAEVELWSLKNDGQAIEWNDGQQTLRFVKQ